MGSPYLEEQSPDPIPSSAEATAALTPSVPKAFTGRLALLLGVQLLFGFSFSLFFMLPKFMKNQLAAEGFEIGLVAAVAGITGVFSIPVIAWAVDRLGRRPLITAGSVLTAGASLLYLFIDDVGPLLYLARGLQGLGFAMAFNAAATMAADQAPPARLSQVIGWFGVSFLSMNAAGPMVAEPLAEAVGWEAVFVVAAVMAALAAGLSRVLTDVSRQRGSSAQQQGSGSWAFLWQSRRLALFFVSSGAGVGLGTMFTFHQPFAIELGAERVGSFFVGYTIAAVGVRLTLGGVADRFGRERVALASTVAYVVTVLAMTQLVPDALLAFGAAFGLAHGLFYPAVNALTVQGLSDHERGRAMSFFNGSFNAGFALSTLCLGAVADHFGYPAVFVLAATWVAAAVPVLWRLKPEA